MDEEEKLSKKVSERIFEAVMTQIREFERIDAALTDFAADVPFFIEEAKNNPCPAPVHITKINFDIGETWLDGIPVYKDIETGNGVQHLSQVFKDAGLNGRLVIISNTTTAHLCMLSDFKKVSGRVGSMPPIEVLDRPFYDPDPQTPFSSKT